MRTNGQDLLASRPAGSDTPLLLAPLLLAPLLLAPLLLALLLARAVETGRSIGRVPGRGRG